MKKFLPALLFVITVLGSCSKEDAKFLKGHFSGSYYYHGPNTPAPVKSPNEVDVKLELGNTFQSSGSPDRKPAGGSGDYKVSGKNIIEFTDKNIWTADFDWNLILNGRFKYEIIGDSLILTRDVEPCPKCIVLPSVYQYRLKRVN